MMKGSLLRSNALVWGDWESVDVSVGDTEVVSDNICWERDGHVSLASLVAGNKLFSTLLR
jgi:hypothetical protein